MMVCKNRWPHKVGTNLQVLLTPHQGWIHKGWFKTSMGFKSAKQEDILVVVSTHLVPCESYQREQNGCGSSLGTHRFCLSGGLLLRAHPYGSEFEMLYCICYHGADHSWRLVEE